MSSHGPSLPSIDYAGISFPSDGITIADLRRTHPERFDVEDGKGFEDGGALPLHTVIYLERLLARAAFEQAQGQPGNVLRDVGLLERDDCVEELTRFYQAYRVSTGAQHTEQLVRGIESQATAQASRGR